MKNILDKYNYTSLTRKDSKYGRSYVAEGTSVPSVTTILSKTRPFEKTQKLNEWRTRVGDAEAERITKEASDVGTIMHNLLESWILNTDYEPGNNMIHQQAKNMAGVIKDNIKDNISEVWGSEVNLYCPQLYAGTTDLVGVWKGNPTIMDFKQTNKPKKREWIDDYFLQAAAYALAHNELYETNIKGCAIFMCSRDLEFQLFESSGSDFDYWEDEWLKRVDQYYKKYG